MTICRLLRIDSFAKACVYGTCLATALLHAESTAKKDGGAVKEIETYADYEKMMSSNQPSIIMVHATWCGACKNFKPVFARVAEKHAKNAEFYTWLESSKELQKELGALDIQGFPTIIYIKKDLGGSSEENFDAKVRDFLGIKDVKVVEPKKEKAEAKKSTAVHELKTKKEFAAMKKSKKPTAVMLYASWCGACSVFKPLFSEAAEKHTDMAFYMLDVDTKELSDEVRGFGVSGIPTTIFFRPNGKELVEDHKMVGARSSEAFEQELVALKKAKKSPKKETAKNKKKSKK